MQIDEDKTAFNARAKASMQEFITSKTWVEKVESIERMNAAGKLARDGMWKALAEQQKQSTTETLDSPFIMDTRSR
ncbi:MAG: hypothetical protein ABI147_13985 [Acidobacteriaceae bacterium]